MDINRLNYLQDRFGDFTGMEMYVREQQKAMASKRGDRVNVVLNTGILPGTVVGETAANLNVLPDKDYEDCERSGVLVMLDKPLTVETPIFAHISVLAVAHDNVQPLV